MEFLELDIAGCYRIQPRVFRDARGSFVKVMVQTMLKRHGLRTDFVEQYYSTSDAGIVRGMHFQSPPHEHAKLVYCANGAVLDVLLDLRKNSPSFGSHCTVSLNSETGVVLYIAPGVAHGFAALKAPALMVYNVTSEYAPAHDLGIRWDSFNCNWPIQDPVISARDSSFPGFSNFESPF